MLGAQAREYGGFLNTTQRAYVKTAPTVVVLLAKPAGLVMSPV